MTHNEVELVERFCQIHTHSTLLLLIILKIYLTSAFKAEWCTSESIEVYASKSNVHASSMLGRNVTLAAIWRIIAWISVMMSLSLFSLVTLLHFKPQCSDQCKNCPMWHAHMQNLKRCQPWLQVRCKFHRPKVSVTSEELLRTHPFSTTSLSVSMLKFHRSRTSFVAILAITNTTLWRVPVCNQVEICAVTVSMNPFTFSCWHMRRVIPYFFTRANSSAG